MSRKRYYQDEETKSDTEEILGPNIMTRLTINGTMISLILFSQLVSQTLYDCDALRPHYCIFESKCLALVDDEEIPSLKVRSKSKRFSKEQLDSVKLRPVYTSFPRDGNVSPGAYLSTPRLNYNSIDNSPPIYPVNIQSPDIVTEYFGSLKKLSSFGATITGINYFIGVSFHITWTVAILILQSLRYG